jgi:hypothetical protein
MHDRTYAVDCLSGKEILTLSNPEIHKRAHKSLVLYTVLSQLNPVHTLKLLF